MGWVLGVGGKPKAGYTIHRYRDRAIVPSMKYRNSHSVATCQAKTVVGSSLTPRAILLVLPCGTVYPVVERHEFTGSDKCCL